MEFLFGSHARYQYFGTPVLGALRAKPSEGVEFMRATIESVELDWELATPEQLE